MGQKIALESPRISGMSDTMVGHLKGRSWCDNPTQRSVDGTTDFFGLLSWNRTTGEAVR
jgi:hypothetical protein